MTTFLQLLSFAILVTAAIAWGRWVHDTWREIKTPEHLADIDLHGLSGDATATARSLGVGLVGQLGEHKRLVDYINATAGTTGGGDTLHAAIRVSQPAPELIRAPATPAGDLDISVEVAGSKVDATGLQKLFGTAEKRGGLSLSVFLDSDGNNSYTGLVSASFKEKSGYRFSLPVKGTMREITEQVAMRFVQAHYAASDPFFAALDPADFRAFWAARRISPDIAIRWESGGRVGSPELRKEAKTAYASIGAMARRYKARPELQKLAAYFASVAEDYDAAVTHLAAAKDSSSDDPSDVGWIDSQIAQLEADKQNAARAVAAAAQAQPEVAAATAAGATAATPGQFSAPEQAILANPDYEELGFSTFARTVLGEAPAKVPTVALVLGGIEAFEPFGERIQPASAEDAPAGGFVDRHVEDVASVIATLAPHAKVRVYRALDAKGVGATSTILATLLRAVADKPDVIALPLGPLRSEFLITAAVAGETLVIASAGNSGTEPELTLPEDAPFLYAGASEGRDRAPFSNFGASVRLYAPGTAVTQNRDGTSEGRGTTFATAVAAATAANLVTLHGALTAEELKARLLGSTELAGDIALLTPPAPGN